MSRNTDTIAAIATAPVRAAIGVLRLSGPRAFAIAQALCGALPEPRRAALRAFKDAEGAIVDRGLLICFPGPASYTGEDLAELQAHGGPVLLDLLLQAAVAAGARIARPGEFSERAYLNGRIDLAQAEAVADLIDAGSRAAVRAAQRSLEGEFSRQVDALTEELTQLRIWTEGALDFSDEDVDWLAEGKLAPRLADWLRSLDALTAQAAQGRRLRDGLTVAIAGQPNVGKSTLLNRLAGVDAAIVSDIPGTTRDLLREHLLMDGLPLTLVDTAGLRDSADVIEQEGIRRAWAALGKAELLLFVIDDRQGFTPEDQALWQRLPPVPRLILRNKCDLSGAEPSAATRDDGSVELRLSAQVGGGIDLLKTEIRRSAGLGAESEPSFSARRRHLAALNAAREQAVAALVVFEHQQPLELAAEHLRVAQQSLGEITGVVSSEDLLGRIFAGFCIGK